MRALDVTVEPLALRGALPAAREPGTPTSAGTCRRSLVVDDGARPRPGRHVDEVVSTVNHVAGHGPRACTTRWRRTRRPRSCGSRRGAPRRAGRPAARRADVRHVGRRSSSSADDDVALHVPPGVAHGYQTLEDGTAHLPDRRALRPAAARTLRWDDPTLGIDVAAARSTVMSEKDREGQPWPPGALITGGVRADRHVGGRTTGTSRARAGAGAAVPTSTCSPPARPPTWSTGRTPDVVVHLAWSASGHAGLPHTATTTTVGSTATLELVDACRARSAPALADRHRRRRRGRRRPTPTAARRPAARRRCRPRSRQAGSAGCAVLRLRRGTPPTGPGRARVAAAARAASR